MVPIDLASEMAAARQRREQQTARLLREARVRAIRAAIRPGSNLTEIEECARSFYPRLSPELLEEATSLVYETSRSSSSSSVQAEAAPDEADPETAVFAELEPEPELEHETEPSV